MFASPAVRQRARDLGIDLGEVRPSEAGRIRHADLDAFLSYGAAKGYAPASATRPDETISRYLESFDRYGIPFNVVYGPEAPDGIVLPELLTAQVVMQALEDAANTRVAED